MAVRFTRIALPLVLVGFAGAGPVRAQETAAQTLVAGQRVITFSPFSASGGGEVGLWRVREPNTRFGWLIGGAISHSGIHRDSDDLSASQSRLELGVGPQVRRYRGLEGRFAPFVFLGGRVRTSIEHGNPPSGPSDTRWDAGLSGNAGFGAEFFPIPNLGLDAQLGLVGNLNYQPLTTGGENDGHQWGVSLGTFSAALSGSFYF